MSFIDYEDRCGEDFTTSSGDQHGPHRCVKHRNHVKDPTDDDHRCCCGASDWVT